MAAEDMDKTYIKRALELAARARGQTSPNPMVGAVLVRAGKIVSEGYHKRAGTPHAEAIVLAEAGAQAKGATLYVSLEPCCHTNKRTPPCTSAIIRSGVKRVVVAMEDPNPEVLGKGIKILKKAGISVDHGILEQKARELNEAYVKYITTGLPFVTLKAAMTLDGKIATPEGESKWITGEKARAFVHRLRAQNDAIITAVGTVLADDPQMTPRGASRIFRAKGGARGPVRVVMDPRLEIPLDAQILDGPPATIIFTRKSGPKASKLAQAGVKVVQLTGSQGLAHVLKYLARRGVASVLIEGGGSLNWHALDEGVVDKALFFVAPKIIGGERSVPVVGGKAFRKLPDAIMLDGMTSRKVGEDLLIQGYIKR